MRSSPLRLSAGIAVLVLAGCPNTVGPAGDANPPTDTGATDAVTSDVTSPPADVLACTADAGVAYPSSAFACASRADCTVVVHGLDCCGSTQLVGVNAAHTADFNAPEMACQTAVHFNMCDCLARQPTAQDGREVPQDAMVGIDCIAGTCRTFVP